VSYLACLDVWIAGCRRRGWLIGLLILVRVLLASCRVFDCVLKDWGFFFLYWAGDHVRNLREDILIHRLNYSLTTMDTDEGLREDYLDKAVQALEK
jgi:hypothetical protein